MFQITLSLAEFLTGADGSAALASLEQADLAEELSVLSRLRKTFSPDRAAVLVEQAQLRRQAVSKFPHASRLWFTDEALQQASSRSVALFRAAMFAQHGFLHVADLGCGIGADSLALAEAGIQVPAIELDPVRAHFAQANAAALGLAGRIQVVCGDWTAMQITADAGFADPSRRGNASGAESRRIFRLDDMLPPMSEIMRLRERLPDLAVKTAPGIADDDIPTSAEVVFIAEGINLKEALLCFGRLRTGAARSAVVLPGPHHLAGAAPGSPAVPREPGAYLYEPNPAIIRAHLVRTLADRIGAEQVDVDIAYLTSDAFCPTPFARVWPIERHGRFNLKVLNRWLRECGAGEVIVKKRGSPVDPDAFRSRLKMQAGGLRKTVFLTHCMAEPWMILCGEELTPPLPRS